MASESSPPLIVGLEMPSVATWSERVVVALGQNPSAFTGPGTNTYLIGTGPRRILVDTGSGRADYLPVLEEAIDAAGCEGIQEILLTHGHPDHIGGLEQIFERFGALAVRKHPWPGEDERTPFPLEPIGCGDTVCTEGATLRAVHTPGHSPDHLCFVLEEEQSLFSGDNVLGVGTTVIPETSGNLADYMRSLDRMLAESPKRIYPAHGPCIENGVGKVEEYIAHRLERDGQILAALGEGASRVTEVVAIVYAAYPKMLHAAAGQSVASHLIKLEREGRVQRHGSAPPLESRWERLSS